MVEMAETLGARLTIGRGVVRVSIPSAMALACEVEFLRKGNVDVSLFDGKTIGQVSSILAKELSGYQRKVDLTFLKKHEATVLEIKEPVRSRLHLAGVIADHVNADLIVTRGQMSFVGRKEVGKGLSSITKKLTTVRLPRIDFEEAPLLAIFKRVSPMLEVSIKVDHTQLVKSLAPVFRRGNVGVIPKMVRVNEPGVVVLAELAQMCHADLKIASEAIELLSLVK